VPKGYLIFQESVHDPEAMATYSAAAGKVIAGEVTVLAVDQDPEVLEGEWPATQTVILEFASVEAAKAWYGSEGYQAAIPLRQAAADTNVVLFAGR
jgi:uncharacterized protein (DUF1330 family)